MILGKPTIVAMIMATCEDLEAMTKVCRTRWSRMDHGRLVREDTLIQASEAVGYSREDIYHVICQRRLRKGQDTEKRDGLALAS
jgi:hypothetical protein